MLRRLSNVVFSSPPHPPPDPSHSLSTRSFELNKSEPAHQQLDPSIENHTNVEGEALLGGQTERDLSFDFNSLVHPKTKTASSQRKLPQPSLIRKQSAPSLVKRESSDGDHKPVVPTVDPLKLRIVRVLSNVEQGRFGIVYVCKDEDESAVVVKTIPKTFPTQSRKHQEQVEAEERALRIGIERKIEYLPLWRGSFQSRSHLMLCMDCEHLGNLTQIVRSHSELLTKENVRTIGKQLCAALNALHEQGVVHRDVKPDNIVLSRDGQRVVLVDFGLCKFLSPVKRSSSFSLTSPHRASEALLKSAPPHTDNGSSQQNAGQLTSPRPVAGPFQRTSPSSSVSSTAGNRGSGSVFSFTSGASKGPKWGQTTTRVGTINYQAPEMIEGKSYGMEVDSWSLGVVIYYLSTGGSLPFEASDPMIVMDLILRNKVEYRVVDDDTAFEFMSRLFVSDAKRRMDLSSSEAQRHNFISGGKEFLCGFSEMDVLCQESSADDLLGGRLLVEALTTVSLEDGDHGSTSNITDDYELFVRIDEDSIVL